MYFSRRLISRERGTPALRAPGGTEPEVRYLTLPGIDYLDVRLLADVCRELDCCLTSIGFQAGGEGNPEVARAQLREKSLIDAGYITRDSHTFPRRFEDIVHTGGEAYRDLRRQAPFHIINVDACGSPATPGARHASRLIDALYRILELQLRAMKGSWLLFVTMDVRPTSIAGGTLDKLCDTIFRNADANSAFARLAATVLGPKSADVRAAARAASTKPGVVFLRLFSLGLAKWLLHLATGESWDMKTHHPYCYSTTKRKEGAPSMTSLAFEFLPPPPRLHDPFGVTRAKSIPSPQREDRSVRAAKKIRDMADADARVDSDEPLRNRVGANLRRGLEEAGYPSVLLEHLSA